MILNASPKTRIAVAGGFLILCLLALVVITTLAAQSALPLMVLACLVSVLALATAAGLLAILHANFSERAMLEAQANAETERREARRVSLEQAIDDFKASVAGILGAVNSHTQDMQSTAQTLTAIAAEANGQANCAVSAADATSGNVQIVASAAEELFSSVQEISRRVQEASSVV